MAISTVQAGSCGNSYCEDDLNETTVTCCEDCGCTGNQTCWGETDIAEQKSCVDPFCGDDFCDETLDHNSIPEEYWKNCGNDCGCGGSDEWEAEKMEGRNLPYYTPTDDTSYDNRCDGCHIDQHCNDANDCTIDECLETAYLNKSVCFNTPITGCTDNDSCCPGECNYADDSDCVGECGDGKCESPESCENCLIDCACDFGLECVDGTCQKGEGYCELKGKIKEDKFCNGNRWVRQFELEAYCDYDYECSSYFCEEHACKKQLIDEEARAYYTKVGLLTVALACLVVYFIIIIQRFWREGEKP